MSRTKWRPLPPGEWYAIPDTINYYTDIYGNIIGPTRKVLTPWLQKRGGYPAVKICDIYGVRTKCIHTLVALTFLGPKPNDNYEVCHRDGNPLNTHKGNLYWGVRKDNIRDMYRHGTWAKERPTNRAEEHSGAKLTNAQVKSARALYGSHGATIKELSEAYGVNYSTMRRILKNITYKEEYIV